MDLTKSALRNPAGLAVVVAILLLLGLFSLSRLPVQLFPDIDRPHISIMTNWRAASPQEIESEILEPQEEVLQGLRGIHNLRADANRGSSWIDLEFGLETDMQRTLVDVISRMNRVPPLPRDADAPIIMLGGWEGDGPALIYYFLQSLPGNEQPIADYLDFVNDYVKPRLESIPGVARVRPQNGGGQAEELQVKFDPHRAAELGIDLTRVAGRIQSANDVSGGFANVGRRQYTIRFKGRYEAEQLADLILEWRDGRPIMLGDIAEVQIRKGDKQGFAIQNGNPAMSIRIDKENEANVLDTLALVKAEVEQIKQELLQQRGLTMEQSFDASVFIKRAVALVSSNLILGVLLSIGVLWLFLRQWRATLVVALAIPLSLLTTFTVLQITGRTLNVISLAGLAFAVGMVLDAAIVVLENIVRYKQRNMAGDEAALKGTKEVWGALLSSTSTTVAIFMPVIFLKDVEGQLFADLALTIAIAVLISLLVAVTVLPAIAGRWLGTRSLEDRLTPLWKKITAVVINLTNGTARRTLVIVLAMGIPVVASYLLLPRVDYLPPVKRDAVDAYFDFPPGANIEVLEHEIADKIVERLAPYMSGEREPALKNYYIITWPNGGTMGVRAKDQSQVHELERIMQEEVLVDLPDTIAFARQGDLFGGFGSNRSIAIHLQSSELATLQQVARTGMELLQEHLPGAQVRANPGLEHAEPELSILPNDRRILEVGYTRNDVSQLVRAFGSGLYMGEYFDGDKRMNIIFRSQDWQNPEELANLPIQTPSGTIVTMDELVDIQRDVGPSQIQRVDGRRTISLQLNPEEGMSLQEAMEIIKQQVEPELLQQMAGKGSVSYGGSADSLKGAIKNMGENFLLALALLFLLMAGLFRSAKDSMMIVLSIPLATVGGMVAVRLLNLVAFQPLDLLTMIGFVILLGLVVNNAILLVHQTRMGEAEGLSRPDAVERAMLLRMRPIFMSTLTSIFGMLPLLLVPGEGSVIYRGLAAVIVGGMSVSTIFTLVLLPALLRVGENRGINPLNLFSRAGS